MKGIGRWTRGGLVPFLVGAVLTAAVSACDGAGVLVPVERGPVLADGLYYFEAWPDRSTRDPDWWGWLDVRVGSDRRIRGSYRLPDQCRDRYNYIVDCVGHLTGRTLHDGRFDFALDEGWIRGEGRAYSRYEAYGRWDARIVGYRERGDFTLSWEQR
jgi:hypothetical protein